MKVSVLVAQSVSRGCFTGVAGAVVAPTDPPTMAKADRRLHAVATAAVAIAADISNTGNLDHVQRRPGLLQNNTGQNILIDGGGLYGDRFDVGQRLLAPAFGELGIRHFDRIILTHDHADHWKGLVYVLEHFPVAELVVGEPLMRYNAALVEVTRQRNIPVRVVEQGWSSFADWQQGVLALYNASAVAANANDASLVLALRTVDAAGREQGMLLAGDLEAEGMQRLIAAGIPTPATLLKLPHHGSGKSETARLVPLLHPEVGLVPVGYQNIYRLPSKPLLEHLEEQQLRIYRTDRDGTVRVPLDAAGWRPQKWQNGLFR